MIRLVGDSFLDDIGPIGLIGPIAVQ
jgi:hypothetical protein